MKYSIFTNNNGGGYLLKSRVGDKTIWQYAPIGSYYFNNGELEFSSGVLLSLHEKIKLAEENQKLNEEKIKIENLESQVDLFDNMNFNEYEHNITESNKNWYKISQETNSSQYLMNDSFFKTWYENVEYEPATQVPFDFENLEEDDNIEEDIITLYRGHFFDPQEIKYRILIPNLDNRALHFTQNKDLAKIYGNNLISYNLKVKKHFYVDKNGNKKLNTSMTDLHSNSSIYQGIELPDGWVFANRAPEYIICNLHINFSDLTFERNWSAMASKEDINMIKLAQNDIFYHGSNTFGMSGELYYGQRDSGWFGSGFYLSKYPAYAKRWGQYLYKMEIPAGNYAEVTVVGSYEKIIFHGIAETANEKAGGQSGWSKDENAWSTEFTSNLKSMGVDGVRVNFNEVKDVEFVIFDPSKIISYEFVDESIQENKNDPEMENNQEKLSIKKNWYKISDKIPGGLSDGKSPSDYNQEQLEKGIKVEMEHTSSREIATEIAMDHLEEDENYYKKLEKIEKHSKFNNRNFSKFSTITSEYDQDNLKRELKEAIENEVDRMVPKLFGNEQIERLSENVKAAFDLIDFTELNTKEDTELLIDLLNTRFMFSIEENVFRDIFSKFFSYSVPNKEVIDEIVEFAGGSVIKDLMGGSGYWSYLINKAGGNSESFDIKEDSYNFNGRKNFLPMKEKDIRDQSLSANEVVFLSWIPCGSNIANNTLKSMAPGQKLIVIGESAGGCTADDEFFDILSKEFTVINNENTVSRFRRIHDYVSFYVKNSNQTNAFNLAKILTSKRRYSKRKGFFNERNKMFTYAQTEDGGKVYSADLKLEVPKTLKNILSTFKSNGFEGLIVGGAVRDKFLGLNPKDLDIEVYGINYEDLYRILTPFDRKKSPDVVGKSFGIIKIVDQDGNDYDFSIPRRESKTGIGHQGFSVEFDPSITKKEAASRRDFTFNALAYDPIDHKVYDYFDGVEDIQNKVIRATSPAFSEDPLRVLRGMQFAGRFGFSLDDETALMTRELMNEYGSLAKERVSGEWMKFFTKSNHPGKALEFLVKSGWVELYPEINAFISDIDSSELFGDFVDPNFPGIHGKREIRQEPEWHPEGGVLTHVIYVLEAAAKIADESKLSGDDRAVILMAALCHDLGKATHTEIKDKDGVMRVTSPGHEAAGVPISDQFLTSIGIKRNLIDRVLPLVGNHMQHITYDAKSKSGNVRQIAERLFPATINELQMIIRSDMGGRPPLPGGLHEKGQQMVDDAINDGVYNGKFIDFIQGRDLIFEFNIKPGPLIGEVLRFIRSKTLEGIINSKEDAINFADEFLKKKLLLVNGNDIMNVMNQSQGGPYIREISNFVWEAQKKKEINSKEDAIDLIRRNFVQEQKLENQQDPVLEENLEENISN